MNAETSVAGASNLMAGLQLKDSTSCTTQQSKNITPDAVLKMTKPSQGYLCPLEANVYGIDFMNFRIKDYDSNKVIFEVSRDPNVVIPHNLPPEMEDAVRSVSYEFDRQFLTLGTVRTLLEFKVGQQPLANFRMIERHFFKGRLVRSYDFTFGFVIPGSTNSWEAIYQVPKLSAQEVQEYVDSPEGHQSDSFYFVDDQLVMHNKAKYTYC